MAPLSWEAVVSTLDRVSDGTAAILTHANRITFCGDVVYKVKRPVTITGILDYADIAARRTLVMKEVAFNRVTAPQLYLGRSVVTQGGTIVDDPSDSLYETGEPLVRMRRFPADALMADKAQVPPPILEQLARTVAKSHAAAERAAGAGKPMTKLIEDVIAEVTRFQASEDASGIDSGLVQGTSTALREEAENVGSIYRERRETGCFRRCHGDLHLQNIAVIEGVAVPFDCIEFSDSLSQIDPYYDLAFLLMDLRHRGMAEGACRVLSSYLTSLGQAGEDERVLYSGLRLLPLFIALRAVIRAYIDARIARESDDQERMTQANQYCREALESLQTEEPTLTAVGGLSGLGKSTLAFGLAPTRGRVPGAVVIRSDAVRKALYGAEPTDTLPKAAYRGNWTNRTFAEMRRLTALCLDQGVSVIADAVHITLEQREKLTALADDRALPFQGFWLTGSTKTAQERAIQRRGDVSDAGPEVIAAMAKGINGAPDDPRWQPLHASGSPHSVLDQAKASPRPLPSQS